MRLLQKKQHGFTLIELIITVAISALVVGGSIAGFVGFTDRQEVLNTAQQIQQALRTAQSKARVREVPTGCATLIGYEAVILSNQTYLRALCPGYMALPGFSYPSLTITTVPPSASQVIRFTTLENGVKDFGGNSLLTTTYLVSDGTYTFQFIVNSNGSISNVTETP